MIYPEINIINLPQRPDRRVSILKELQYQSIENYQIWDGITDPVSATAGISRAHKQIVHHAREYQWPSVTIAEDDIQFTAPGAFQYFREQRPAEYDIYLGVISWGKITANNTVADFSGLLLYEVHQRFYDRFLSLPEDRDIDRELRGKGAFVVCPSFVVIEHAGKSDNTGKVDDNRIYYAGRPLFGRPSISFEEIFGRRAEQ